MMGEAVPPVLRAFTTAFLLITVLRVYNILRGILWTYVHGRDFKRDMLALPPRARSNVRIQELILDAHKANFFPVGIRAYRFRRWSRGGRSPIVRLLRRSLRILKLLWYFPVYALLSFVYICALSLGSSWVPTDSRFIRELAMTALLLLLAALLLAIEGFVVTRYIGSWGVLYHGLPDGDDPTEGAPRGELLAPGGAIVVTYLLLLASLLLVSVKFRGFAEMQSQDNWARLGDAAYYSFALPLGMGPEPLNTLARLVVVFGRIIIPLLLVQVVQRLFQAAVARAH